MSKCATSLKRFCFSNPTENYFSFENISKNQMFTTRIVHDIQSMKLTLEYDQVFRVFIIENSDNIHQNHILSEYLMREQQQ